MKSLTIGGDLEQVIVKIVDFLTDLQAEANVDSVDYTSAVRIGVRRFLSMKEREDDEDKNTTSGR
jgi:hypothetical protein